MPRRFEELARHDASVETLLQQGNEVVSVAGFEPGKYRCPEAAGFAIKHRVRGEKFINQIAIRLQKSAGPLPYRDKMIEHNHGKQLGRVHWASVSKINHLPHPLHQVGLGQNPSAANAAQSVSFG